MSVGDSILLGDKEGEMKVYTIQPDVELNKYTECTLKAALDGLEIELENATPGTIVTIEVGEMSKEDYDKLPEYEGP